MKTLVQLFAIVLLLPAASAWACAPLAQGMEPMTLASTLDRADQMILESRPELRGYSNHIFNWESVKATVGVEGSCTAKFIDGRVNIQMQREKQVCVFSADVSYTDFMKQAVTVTPIREQYCF